MILVIMSGSFLKSFFDNTNYLLHIEKHMNDSWKFIEICKVNNYEKLRETFRKII